jgi:hypothetical protein
MSAEEPPRPAEPAKLNGEGVDPLALHYINIIHNLHCDLFILTLRSTSPTPLVIQEWTVASEV